MQDDSVMLAFILVQTRLICRMNMKLTHTMSRSIYCSILNSDHVQLTKHHHYHSSHAHHACTYLALAVAIYCLVGRFACN